MIIDFHTHAFPDALAARALSSLVSNIREKDRFAPLTDGTAASLLRQMDDAGVDVSVLQPVVTKPSQFVHTNEWAASLRSDRIIPFGGIYPHSGDYKRDIDTVVSLGLKGLKFHCEFQNFVVDAPEMLRIYDYALSRGLILLHHAGYDPGFDPPFHSSPKQFAHIADAMKGGVIVVAHFGGHAQWDDVEKYLVGKNIYLDTAMGFEYYPQDQFVRIVKNHGADKVLFASDSPWSNPKNEIALLRKTPLSDGEKERILGGNARRLLEI